MPVFHGVARDFNVTLQIFDAFYLLSAIAEITEALQMTQMIPDQAFAGLPPSAWHLPGLLPRRPKRLTAPERPREGARLRCPGKHRTVNPRS